MATKYQVVADSLRAHIQAGKYANATVLPPEFAIAEEYQVSRQTVRQALALLAQDGLIETRRGSGSHILRGEQAAAARRYHIAVIVTYIGDYIFPSTLREIEGVLSGQECTSSIFATGNQVSNERKILSRLLEQPVDGIIVEATKSALPNPNLDLYQKIMSSNIPLVFVHGYYADLPESHFVLDANYDGGLALARYLADQGRIHIGGVFKSDDIQGHGRYAGYAAGLKEQGLELRDQNVFWFDTGTKEILLAGDDAPVRAFFDAALREVDAFVCYNDELGCFFEQQILARGLRIPEDIALVSFDDSNYSKLSPVPLTSLSHGKENTGRTAAQMMLQLLRGEYCQSVQIPWELVVRESSGRRG